jgi:hypothetical protein
MVIGSLAHSGIFRLLAGVVVFGTQTECMDCRDRMHGLQGRMSFLAHTHTYTHIHKHTHREYMDCREGTSIYLQ